MHIKLFHLLLFVFGSVICSETKKRSFSALFSDFSEAAHDKLTKLGLSGMDTSAVALPEASQVGYIDDFVRERIKSDWKIVFSQLNHVEDIQEKVKAILEGERTAHKCDHRYIVEYLYFKAKGGLLGSVGDLDRLEKQLQDSLKHYENELAIRLGFFQKEEEEGQKILSKLINYRFGDRRPALLRSDYNQTRKMRGYYIPAIEGTMQYINSINYILKEIETLRPKQ